MRISTFNFKFQICQFLFNSQIMQKISSSVIDIFGICEVIDFHLRAFHTCMNLKWLFFLSNTKKKWNQPATR